VPALLLVSLVGLIAFGWPLLAHPGTGVGHDADAPWLFVLLLPLLILVLLAELTAGGVDAKAVAMLGVLAALGTALRPFGAGITGWQPMFVLLVLGGRALGPGFGFVLGATTMFGSALLTVGSVRGCRSRCSRRRGPGCSPGCCRPRPDVARCGCWPGTQRSVGSSTGS
jgi:energy-coupling factor transport system substrate-specific component